VAISTVRLKNTGGRHGREVVQLYLVSEAVAAADEMPPRQLAGFAVVASEPGQTVEAVVEIPLRAFQRWGASSGWELRAGLYTLQAAHSSGDVRAEVSLEVPPRA
jgi:beta-glucosidase